MKNKSPIKTCSQMDLLIQMEPPVNLTEENKHDVITALAKMLHEHAEDLFEKKEVQNERQDNG